MNASDGFVEVLRALAETLGSDGNAMDLDRVRRIVAEFAEILEDPQRTDELDELIRRSGT